MNSLNGIHTHVYIHNCVQMYCLKEKRSVSILLRSNNISASHTDQYYIHTLHMYLYSQFRIKYFVTILNLYIGNKQRLFRIVSHYKEPYSLLLFCFVRYYLYLAYLYEFFKKIWDHPKIIYFKEFEYKCNDKYAQLKTTSEYDISPFKKL